MGPNAYVITSVTEGRQRHFTDSAVTAMCVEKLEQAAGREDMDLMAFVFMPDHLHMLVAGRDESSLARFMKRFKQASAFAFKQSTGETLWQKSFHDHILRREEDFADVARYIAENPVRAGIVSDWEAYPFTGGWLYDAMLSGDLEVAATFATQESRGEHVAK